MGGGGGGVGFFFNDTATTEIYTLSLHDALPISSLGGRCPEGPDEGMEHSSKCDAVRNCSPTLISHGLRRASFPRGEAFGLARSEEHTSELQSRFDLVCRLLLEKKKRRKIKISLKK